MMRVISYPKREKDRGPRRPAWWRTFWMPTGTIVENDGVQWEMCELGAGLQTWRQWVRVKPPTMVNIAHQGIGKSKR